MGRGRDWKAGRSVNWLSELKTLKKPFPIPFGLWHKSQQLHRSCRVLRLLSLSTSLRSLFWETVIEVWRSHLSTFYSVGRWYHVRIPTILYHIHLGTNVNTCCSTPSKRVLGFLGNATNKPDRPENTLITAYVCLWGARYLCWELYLVITCCALQYTQGLRCILMSIIPIAINLSYS